MNDDNVNVWHGLVLYTNDFKTKYQRHSTGGDVTTKCLNDTMELDIGELKELVDGIPNLKVIGIFAPYSLQVPRLMLEWALLSWLDVVYSPGMVWNYGNDALMRLKIIQEGYLSTVELEDNCRLLNIPREDVSFNIVYDINMLFGGGHTFGAYVFARDKFDRVRFHLPLRFVLNES